MYLCRHVLVRYQWPRCEQCPENFVNSCVVNVIIVFGGSCSYILLVIRLKPPPPLYPLSDQFSPTHQKSRHNCLFNVSTHVCLNCQLLFSSSFCIVLSFLFFFFSFFSPALIYHEVGAGRWSDSQTNTVCVSFQLCRAFN